MPVIPSLTQETNNNVKAVSLSCMTLSPINEVLKSDGLVHETVSRFLIFFVSNLENEEVHLLVRVGKQATRHVGRMDADGFLLPGRIFLEAQRVDGDFVVQAPAQRRG
jgi:hypothetical protein